MYEELFWDENMYTNTFKLTTTKKSIIYFKYKTESLHFDSCYELTRHAELSCLYITLKYK